MAASLIRSTHNDGAAAAPVVAGLLPTASHPVKSGWEFVKPSVVPGFGLTFGYTLTYLSLIVLIPILGLFLKAAGVPFDQIIATATSPRTLNALRVSFGSSLIAALVNVVFGVLIAWVLVRYTFPFRRVLDAIVDLPFALPTAVAGIALSTLYAPKGWIGSLLAPLGIKIAYTPSGIVIALIFIAGNLPNVSEIAPLLIVIKLEEFDQPGAAVIAAIMLIISFVMLLVINLIQAFSRRRFGNV